MARIQTRRTISLSGALYRQCREVADREGVSLSNVMHGLLSSWLRERGVVAAAYQAPQGPRPRRPRAPSPDPRSGVVARSGTPVPPTPLTRRAPAGTCGICVGDAAQGSGGFAPIGRGGAVVRVCSRCETEHPRQGGYSFSEASRNASSNVTAVGEGNRRTSSAGGAK